MKRTRTDALVQAIKEQTKVNKALLARLTPPAPPKPAPVPETSLPGHCRGCGWKVPPKHDGCARCGTVTLRRYPEWLTPDKIEEQKALNPDKKWPTPPKRWTHVSGIEHLLGRTNRDREE